MSRTAPLPTAALALAVLLAACGGAADPAPPPPPPDGPSPLDVRIEADEAREARARIGAEGGTLRAVAADGAAFELAIPAGALLGPIELSMTPISAVEGLPLDGGLVAAVRLEPDDLLLLEPAVLTIAPPAGVDAGALTAFNSHGGGEEFYFQPHDAADGAARLHLSHFSNPGVGTGDVSDLLEPLVPTDEGDRFENDAALAGEDFMLRLGEFHLVVKGRLEAARSDDARLRDAIRAFTTWRKEVSRAGLDEDFRREIYEGWTLVAQGIENAVDRASAACVDDTDLSRLGDILGWVAWVRSNPRLAPYFEGRLEAFIAKAEACASFELEIRSTLSVRTRSPSGEGYDITDITSEYVVSSTTPVRYDAEEGALRGEGDLRVESWTTSGWFAWFGPPRDPDCPNVRPGELEVFQGTLVGNDLEGKSELDGGLLTSLNTGRPVYEASLRLFPGITLQSFRMSCDEGPQETGGIENHGPWGVHLAQAYGYGGPDMRWWKVDGFVFDGGVAEVEVPARYSGIDPNDAGEEDPDLLDLDATTSFTLRHTPGS